MSVSDKAEVFRLAIAGKPDSRVVHVRATCLLAAFGAGARALVPYVDLPAVARAALSGAQGELARLQGARSEIVRRERLGFSVGRQLAELDAEISAVQAGRVQFADLVPIRVGALRAALDANAPNV